MLHLLVAPWQREKKKRKVRRNPPLSHLRMIDPLWPCEQNIKKADNVIAEKYKCKTRDRFVSVRNEPSC